MTNITTLDDVTVSLVASVGSDKSVAQAARVSVVGENAISDDTKDEGLINYLMRSKHGSPFEHNSMTFYVKAPIFVFREFQRHRVGFSYNEMSGRYTELPNEFYIPNADRPLVNQGKSSKPDFVAGSEKQYDLMVESVLESYGVAWDNYQLMLDAGIGKEVARIVLPVGIMSQMYVTMNLRSALNFLALRTSNESATFKSHPQFEIELVAQKIEEEVERLFPVSYAAWNKNGRVAP